VILYCIWVVRCSVLLLQLCDPILYLSCSLLSITPSTLWSYIVSELFFVQYYSFNFRILHCIWVVLCSVLLLQLLDSTLYLSCSFLSITPSTLGFYIVSELFFAQYYTFNFVILYCIWVFFAQYFSFNFVILHCIWVVLCSVLLLQLCDSTLYLSCSLLSITPSTLGLYIVSELLFAQYYSFNFVILHCIWVVLCSVLLLQLCDPILYLSCSLLSITLSTLGFYIVSELFFPQYYSFNFRILHCIWVVLCSVLLLQLWDPILYLSVLCSVLLFQLCDSTLYLSCSLLSITPSTLGFYIVSELYFTQYYSFNFRILHCIWVVLCSVLLLQL
jgi:hypothetical protein